MQCDSPPGGHHVTRHLHTPAGASTHSSRERQSNSWERMVHWQSCSLVTDYPLAACTRSQLRHHLLVGRPCRRAGRLAVGPTRAATAARTVSRRGWTRTSPTAASARCVAPSASVHPQGCAADSSESGTALRTPVALGYRHQLLQRASTHSQAQRLRYAVPLPQRPPPLLWAPGAAGDGVFGECGVTGRAAGASTSQETRRPG